MIGIFKKDFGFEFGVEISHPISEAAEEVFHPHINLLWLQKPGQKPFIDLDKLRQAWAKLLQYGGPVDVHHAYYTDKKKIMHKCRYVARSFPGLSIWVGSLRWYGKPPKMDPEVIVCPKCGQCYIIMDFITEHEYLEERAQHAEHGFSP